MNISDPKDCEY